MRSTLLKTPRYLIGLSAGVVFVLMSASITFAQIVNPAVGEELGGGTGSADAAATGSIFLRYLIVLWRALITMGGLMVILYFLWGGLEWISAGGDAAKVGKARDKMTQAVVGLVVLVGTFAIITLINQLFFGDQFNLLQLRLPDST